MLRLIFSTWRRSWNFITTGVISILPPHAQEEKNILMSQYLNPGKQAPQVNPVSITPWPLGLTIGLRCFSDRIGLIKTWILNYHTLHSLDVWQPRWQGLPIFHGWGIARFVTSGFILLPKNRGETKHLDDAGIDPWPAWLAKASRSALLPFQIGTRTR